MNAVLTDIDPGPVVACRGCHDDMPAAHLLCAWCLADGKRPNASDEFARNARVTEAILWG